MITKEQIKIKSRDGYDIPAVIHFPSKETDIKSNVILLHGIFSSKDEDGRFVRQSNFLTYYGFRVIRFDFRGHGENPIKSDDMTISGMIIDLKSVIEYIKSHFNEKFYIVASSFGGSVLLLYLQLKNVMIPEKIIFLNPVVDYETTFLNPIAPEMKNLFNNSQWEQLDRLGYITPLDNFNINEKMIIEMSLLRPYIVFDSLSIPTRIIHGDSDNSVPYEITMAYSLRSKSVEFKIIKGADHAFVPEEHENESFNLILEWLE